METIMATIVKQDKSIVVTDKKGKIKHHIPAKTTPTTGRAKAKHKAINQNPKVISYDAIQKRYWKGMNESKYKLVYDEETSPKVLETLSLEDDPALLKSIAKSKIATKKAFKRIAKSEDIQVLVELSNNPNVSPRILDKLAKLKLVESEDFKESSRQYIFLKSNIAKNPNTKDKTLLFLYSQSDNDKLDPAWAPDYKRILHTELAKNKNTPASVLHLIAKEHKPSDANRKLFDALANNPATSRQTLKFLVDIGKPYFFGNPNLDAELLDYIAEVSLSRGFDRRLLSLVTDNIQTSTKTLDRIYDVFENNVSPNGDYYSGIDAIKTHPNTSDETRSRLKQRYELAYSSRERIGF